MIYRVCKCDRCKKVLDEKNESLSEVLSKTINGIFGFNTEYSVRRINGDLSENVDLCDDCYGKLVDFLRGDANE